MKNQQQHQSTGTRVNTLMSSMPNIPGHGSSNIIRMSEDRFPRGGRGVQDVGLCRGKAPPKIQGRHTCV